MTTIYWARHGEYQNPNNVNPFRLTGFPLNQKGKQQSEQIANYLLDKKISAVYSSSILRCKQTSRIISKKLHLKPKYSKLILETNSPLKGSPKTRLTNWWAETLQHPFHLKHGGETLEDIFSRVNKFFQAILKRHQNQNVLVVSHGEPTMILVYHLVDNNHKKYFEQSKPNISKGGLVQFKFKGNQLTDFKQII